MNIGFASVAEVDQLWPMIVGEINKALSKNDSAISAGQLWQMCRGGHAFICIVSDGHEATPKIKMASVWRFEDCGILRCLVLVGHEMPSWLPMANNFITRIAKENGAKTIKTDGRRGWMRLFKKARMNNGECEVSIDG